MQDNFLQGFVSDEDEDLKSKGSYAKFGLNTGTITKFEYNPNGGSGGAEADCLDIEITIEEKAFRTRLYPVTKVFGKNGEITDTNSPEYKKNFEIAQKTLKGIITHYLKVFYTEEELKTSLNQVFPTTVDFFKFVAQGIQKAIAAKGPEVDVFLQYQWNIASGQDRTYLELPKNMKDGSFICKPIVPVGEWKELRNEEGLSYVDNAGNIHRFRKPKEFLESNKGKQQKNDSSTPAGDAAITGQAPAATGTTW